MDPSLHDLIVASPGVMVILKWAFDRYMKRADKTEENVEASRIAAQASLETEVKSLAERVTTIKSDIRLMETKFSGNDNEFRVIKERLSEEIRGLKERIEGVSDDHKARLKELESLVTQLKTIIDYRLTDRQYDTSSDDAPGPTFRSRRK
jgi:predicted  nucleic acid-binding Zn-ribbon protein